MGFWNFWKKTGEKAEKSTDLDPMSAHLQAIKAQNAQLRAQRIKAQEQIELKRLEMAQRKQELEERIEMRKLEQELADLEDEDDDEDDDEEEDLVSKAIGIIADKFLVGGQISNRSPLTAQASTQTPPTENFMLERWNSLNPVVKAQAKRMSDDQLREFLISQQPDIDAQTVAKAIEVVRTQP